MHTWRARRVCDRYGIEVTGNLGAHVYSKDVFLHLCGTITADGATYMSMEFLGSTVDDMSVESKAVMSKHGNRSRREMREFWDTHDSAEYFEDMKDDEVGVEFNRDKGVLVIPMGEDRVRSLRGIALEEGVSSNVLLRNWIDECIKARGKLKGD